MGEKKKKIFMCQRDWFEKKERRRREEGEKKERRRRESYSGRMVRR